MLSTLLNLLITKFEMDHQDLADVMGVKLQRVRDLATGRAKKLTREESASLIQKLGVRADWLITGEGAMLGRDEDQDEFIARQQAINQTQALINAMPLNEFLRKRLCAVMTGVSALDGPAIAKTILSETSNEAVDVALVVKISTSLEAALTKLRARISLEKKEELVRLFYEHFALKGHVEEEMIERHLKLVVNQ